MYLYLKYDRILEHVEEINSERTLLHQLMDDVVMQMAGSQNDLQRDYYRRALSEFERLDRSFQFRIELLQDIVARFKNQESGDLNMIQEDAVRLREIIDSMYS